MTKAILLSPKMRNYERTYGGITDFSEIRKQVHAGAQDVIRGNL